MEKKTYFKPYVLLTNQEFEDIICVSLVEGEHDIFDYDEEL